MVQYAHVSSNIPTLLPEVYLQSCWLVIESAIFQSWSGQCSLPETVYSISQTSHFVHPLVTPSFDYRQSVHRCLPILFYLYLFDGQWSRTYHFIIDHFLTDIAIILHFIYFLEMCPCLHMFKDFFVCLFVCFLWGFVVGFGMCLCT